MEGIHLVKIGEQPNIMVHHYICDTDDHVKKLPTNVPSGSDAVSIQSGKVFMIGDSKIWHEFGANEPDINPKDFTVLYEVTLGDYDADEGVVYQWVDFNINFDEVPNTPIYIEKDGTIFETESGILDTYENHAIKVYANGLFTEGKGIGFAVFSVDEHDCALIGCDENIKGSHIRVLYKQDEVEPSEYQPGSKGGLNEVIRLENIKMTEDGGMYVFQDTDYTSVYENATLYIDGLNYPLTFFLKMENTMIWLYNLNNLNTMEPVEPDKPIFVF